MIVGSRTLNSNCDSSFIWVRISLLSSRFWFDSAFFLEFLTFWSEAFRLDFGWILWCMLEMELVLIRFRKVEYRNRRRSKLMAWNGLTFRIFFVFFCRNVNLILEMNAVYLKILGRIRFDSSFFRVWSLDLKLLVWFCVSSLTSMTCALFFQKLKLVWIGFKNWKIGIDSV